MSKMFLTAALAAALCLTTSPGRAQEGSGDDAEVTRMAKEHYKAGLDAYKAGQYDVAIKELKRAYLLKRLPALLINIGATYRKMGDLDLALHFYKKYLDEAPPDAHDRADIEATVKEIEAEKAGGGSAAAPPPADTTAPAAPSETTKEEAPPPKRPPMPTEWKHTVIDAAPPNTPLDVRVSMPIMKGVKVYVFYRPAGEADFQQVLMRRHGPEKIGRIPADAVNGNAIQYYIEARNAKGEVVNSSGSQSSPNIVMIDPSAPPQVVASLDTSREREAPPTTEGTENNGEEKPASVDRDEEEAPLLVEEGKKRKKEREHRGGGEGGSHTLRWAGVGLAAAGAAVIGVGVGMGVLAKQQSDAVTQDAHAGNPFEFSDPTAPGGKDDHYFQTKGQQYNAAGIACDVIGGVLAATGIALIAVDATRKGGNEKPKHHHDSDMSWYVAPAAGRSQVGLGGGFSF